MNVEVFFQKLNVENNSLEILAEIFVKISKKNQYDLVFERNIENLSCLVKVI